MIAAEARFDRIDRCLRSLDAAGAAEIDKIVVHAGGRRLSHKLREFHPGVELIDGATMSKPARRAAAMRAARAGRVAMIHENYVLDAAWVEAAGRAAAGVVCGEVAAPAAAGLLAQACFLWEYSHLTPPLKFGELDQADARMIAAGNVVYDLAQVGPEDLENASSELEYHEQLYRRGLTFCRDPALRAVYPPPAVAEFVKERYGWSVDWVRRHRGGMSPPQRWLAAIGRVGLAPLLLARFFRRMASRPRLWGLAAAASPLFVVLAVTQSLAEIRTYLEDDR